MNKGRSSNAICLKLAEVASWPLTIFETIIREIQFDRDLPNNVIKKGISPKSSKPKTTQKLVKQKNMSPASISTVFDSSYDLKTQLTRDYSAQIQKAEIAEDENFAENDDDDYSNEDIGHVQFKEESDLQMALDEFISDYRRNSYRPENLDDSIDQEEGHDDNSSFSGDDNESYVENDSDDLELYLEEMADQDFDNE